MRIYMALLFLLAACSDSGSVIPIDPQKILGEMDGPKVPTMQDTLLESAKKSEDQGDFTQAAAYYNQALAKKPDDKDLLLLLAEALRRGGNHDNAIAVYDKLLSKEKSMAAALEGKGLALIGKGDFDGPTDLFQQALAAEPKRWKTLNALGILFATRGLNTEAQQYFNEALKQSPNNPSILNNLGLSQALSRDFDVGIRVLNQTANLTLPGSGERKQVDLNLALVYAIAGKLEDARIIAEHYYSGPALDNNMGLYAHLAKNNDLAKAHLNMALTNSKIFYERAWNNLQAIQESNNSPKSSKQKVKVIKKSPEKPTPKDEISTIIGNPAESESPEEVTPAPAQ